ncbi:2'-deoxycytidine 5'-triphosphate deaminase [Enterovirga aerilata]|uniref:2'-deoxycytidine 5'-triphosphate deaminase n=1 Tax=Enterovirga aerilata TaxID=2730920 RepID=A0A849I0R6_9HYPH|nr:2'-deoxycytidine 5'-triphosphate deaminase [Enterovirga sp. DB1703]NNM70918.1 2'-deoxycytidine 5'-triphosphate deaminase [Enterovirga sp. DB1703]
MNHAPDPVLAAARWQPASRPGLLPRQAIRSLVERGCLRAAVPLDDAQFQPASLDLRLGAYAYRVRASFLPGARSRVEDKLEALQWERIDLSGGAIFERGCVYVVELSERLDLPAHVSAAANPKSSTGRLDVFTRLITDRSEAFDAVEPGYSGPLYAEVSPRTFSIKVRQGTRLNQIRFRQHGRGADEAGTLGDQALRELHARSPLVDADELAVRNGLVLRIELGGLGPQNLVGYRAQRHTDVIDVERIGGYRPEDFWEPIPARPDARLILDPNEFYILASKERLHIPPHLAAEMVPIDPAMGEFRVHYAGFFDPGFGYAPSGHPGSRAVMEVRSHEVPFNLEDGQMVCRLAYEQMAEEPDALYGAIGTSNYQGQALKLSKQFIQP